MLYTSISTVDFDLDDLESQPLPHQVLFVRPDHFQVEYVINPHMEGRVGTVDKARASNQWTGLRDTYRSLGLHVTEMSGDPRCPDMVFCANQSLPGLNRAGARAVMLSNMASAARAPEVAHFETFFSQSGYEISRLTSESRLEGCGDVLWHQDVRLLWCGYGFRSDSTAFEEVCRWFGVPGILLELVDPAFYHLDTCLSILDRETALWVPSAFAQPSAELIHEVIPNLIEVPREEAQSLLACNAHSPDGRHVIIQSGCRETSSLLQRSGYRIVEVDTDEFLKSGGSVFCLKQMYW